MYFLGAIFITWLLSPHALRNLSEWLCCLKRHLVNSDCQWTADLKYPYRRKGVDNRRFWSLNPKFSTKKIYAKIYSMVFRRHWRLVKHQRWSQGMRCKHECWTAWLALSLCTLIDVSWMLYRPILIHAGVITWIDTKSWLTRGFIGNMADDSVVY